LEIQHVYCLPSFGWFAISAAHATLVDQEQKRTVARQAILDRMEQCLLDAGQREKNCLKEIK